MGWRGRKQSHDQLITLFPGALGIKRKEKKKEREDAKSLQNKGREGKNREEDFEWKKPRIKEDKGKRGV